LLLDIAHPELNVTVLGVDTFNEFYLLSLDGHHGDHAVIITEFQVSNSLEHLPEMASYTANFFRLRQDFEQVIIG